MMKIKILRVSFKGFERISNSRGVYEELDNDDVLA